MRFAYMDSQGKEVGIPTLEGVQLRIELGAIGENTLFFDAREGRWAPAGEHPVFRRLAAEIRERSESGFRIPGPPGPPSAPPSTGAEPAREPDAPGGGGEPGEEAMGSADRASDESGGGAEAPRPERPRRVRAPDPFALEDGPPPEPPPAEAEEAEEEEVSAEEAEALASLGHLDLVGDEGPEASPRTGAPPEEPDLHLEDLGALDLAPELEEQKTRGRYDQHEPGEVPEEREAPAAEEEEPAWRRWARDEPEDDGRSLRPADPWGEPEATETERLRRESSAREHASGQGPRAPSPDEPRRPVRTLPRSDPAKLRRQKARRGLMALGLALIAVAVGAWFGWQALRDGGGRTAATVEPVDTTVTIPHLDAELVPVMRALADSAYGDVLDSLRATSAELPAEPNPDWLAGIYLSGASGYPDVLDYWQAMGDWLDRAQARDEDLFLAAFRARMAADTVAAEARDPVLARARAGFQATRPDRREVYGLLRDLVDASTGLHDFLVVNEAQITYDPGVAGVSRDPVRQAIPATQALGDEMWDRVAEIPRALDALGTLDRVATERVVEVFLERLGETGIR